MQRFHIFPHGGPIRRQSIKKDEDRTLKEERAMWPITITLRGLMIIILLVADMAFAATPNRVTILYDSFGKSQALTMDWGFAALVEYGGKRILFDTGNNSQIFEHNVK